MILFLISTCFITSSPLNTVQCCVVYQTIGSAIGENLVATTLSGKTKQEQDTTSTNYDTTHYCNTTHKGTTKTLRETSY